MQFSSGRVAYGALTVKGRSVTLFPLFVLFCRTFSLVTDKMAFMLGADKRPTSRTKMYGEEEATEATTQKDILSVTI